jgi:hypothetical protein
MADRPSRFPRSRRRRWREHQVLRIAEGINRTGPRARWMAAVAQAVIFREVFGDRVPVDELV